MDVTFQERELRDLCASADLCKQKYGSEATRDLFALVSDIESSRSVAELKVIHDILFEGDSLSVSLSANLVARFISASAGGGGQADEPTNWSNVRRLRLVSLEQ